MTAIPGRKVVIAGQGYVGVPLAMSAVEAGNTVVGFDTAEARTKALAAGQSYVEDVSDERLLAALATGRYIPTTEPRECIGFDVAVISVPTPLREGAPDLSYIESATRMLARLLRPGVLVILESTTYPGTTEELVGAILHEHSGLVPGLDFFLGYSPERIDPGNPDWNFVNTPKVISGVNEASLEAVRQFYETLVDTVVPVSGTREAELAKLLENTFRHVNIALVNELAVFAADLGIDIWEAIGAASSKPFGFMRFVPGPGVGGHCLPIDPSYLSWRVKNTLGHNFRFVELANDINEHMPEYVVKRLQAALNAQRKAVNGSRVLLLGLTYKRNTSDARESPAIEVARLLVALGAEVHAVDPHITEPIDVHVHVSDLTADEVTSADVVVLLSDHDCFDLDMVQQQAAYVLDTRGRLQGANVERL